MLIDALPKDAFLVLVTGGKEVQSLRLKENVKILSSIPEEDLPALYSLARCFVSPSLAEGFNFPVLEAMRCGCPVIATNRGSTPEVAGGCALLIEPVEEALRSALKNPPQGNRELAIAHARKFSWEKAAQQTAKIYTSCL
jgi:glycosyltransferase involved in cell wall biosynthesis